MLETILFILMWPVIGVIFYIVDAIEDYRIAKYEQELAEEAGEESE